MSNLSPVVAELERLYVELRTAYAPNVQKYIGQRAAEALNDSPVISVASRGKKRTVNAWYRPSVWVDTTDDLLDALVGDRNDDGSRVQTKRAEIVIASEVLREDALTVAVEVTRGLLCHAMQAQGYAVPGESNYYPRSWERWAEVCELRALLNTEQPSKGWAKLTPRPAFVSTVTPLLRPEAIDISRDSAEKGNVGSRMVKYRCGCTTVRAATVLLATCIRCGNAFAYADSAPVPSKVAARARARIANDGENAEAFATAYGAALARDDA